MADKPIAPAADRNKQPILEALLELLIDGDKVFEVGSGTGQHVCHFAANMPLTVWQPSDIPDKLAGIQMWMGESECTNILDPIVFDLRDATLPAVQASVWYTANTLHIVDWNLVERLFDVVAKSLAVGGKFVAYGPFRIGGEHVSRGNVEFDQQLRANNPHSGIRDIVELDTLAAKVGFLPASKVALPANNFLLIWQIAH